MFKNYLVTALNNLIKNKLYSFINIVGLAVGLAACILIALYVQDELGYDKHWQKADQIYRINNEYLYPGSERERTDTTPLNLLPALKSYFPTEIDAGSRVRAFGLTDMSVNNTVYAEQLALVDKDFTELFAIKTSAGSLADTFTTVNNIALSEELAAKFFGDADPMGETISVPGSFMFPARDYRVTAVYSLPSDNTVLQTPALALLDGATMPETMNSWANNILHTYVRISDGVDVKIIHAGLPDFVNLHALVPDSISQGGENLASNIYSYSLQPITDIYLDPWSERDSLDSGNRTTNLIFALIASLVLVVGCINFAILTAAKSSKREKEVAMRKVLGAKRSVLVVQFLGEAILIALLATVLGLVVLELAMPVYSSFSGKELSVDYGSAYTYGLLLALVFVTGAMGGFYPAIIMSGSRLAKSLKGVHSVASSKTYSLKDGLVILQFTVSVSLIIATAFIYLQSSFASRTNLGFNPESLLVIEEVLSIPDLRQGLGNKGIVLKQQLDNIDGITSSGLAMLPPVSNSSMTRSVTLQPDVQEVSVASGELVSMRQNYIDADFFDVYQIPIVAGRNYDDAFQQDHIPSRPQASASGQPLNFNLIINESAVRQLGLTSSEQAIGRVVRADVGLTSPVIADFNIVGVAADSRFHSPRADIPPELYFFTPELGGTLAVRFQGNSQEILASILALWPSLYEDAPLRTVFVDQAISDQFIDIQTQGTMLAGFSFLAVVLACLGLLGMSAFTIDRRTKEIGLRKVMGAKIKDIVKLLAWQFSKPVIIANLIAWPFIIWIMVRWLESFSNRIDSIWLLPLCLGTGVISLLFMWVTVAGNTTRIARRSPIHALRYE